ncbi:MAG TPA: FemAB, partial [Sphingopyxis sp.]
MARGGVNAPTLPVKEGFSGAPLSDAAAWDAYVAAHPDATPFHSRAWCEAITRATGHRCHLVTARNATGALAGLLPLHHVRSPLFGQALVGSGFGVGGGILADNPGVEATLAHGAAAMAKPLGVPSVELRGGPLPASEGWRVEEGVYAGFARELAADNDAELLAIPRKQRAEVRKVLESGLTVTAGRSDTERRDHY